MQASNFGGTFDQLFLWIFLWNFHRKCLSTFSIPWCKKVKNDQKLKSTVGPALSIKSHSKNGQNPKEIELMIRSWLFRAGPNFLKKSSGLNFVPLQDKPGPYFPENHESGWISLEFLAVFSAFCTTDLTGPGCILRHGVVFFRHVFLSGSFQRKNFLNWNGELHVAALIRSTAVAFNALWSVFCGVCSIQAQSTNRIDSRSVKISVDMKEKSRSTDERLLAECKSSSNLTTENLLKPDPAKACCIHHANWDKLVQYLKLKVQGHTTAH